MENNAIKKICNEMQLPWKKRTGTIKEELDKSDT
jgi:hypothetical protein